MEITEFLLARIAEDEADLATPDFEEQQDSARSPGWGARTCSICNHETWGGTEVVTEEAINEHLDVVHRQPRALAACEAKRRIVGLHASDGGDIVRGWAKGWAECVTCFDPETSAGEYSFMTWPCPTLRALASEYADHPDYRPEWRP